MKTEQINTEQTQNSIEKQVFEKMLKKQAPYMMYTALFLRLLIFLPVGIFESLQYGEFNVFVAISVFLKLIVFEVVFCFCSIIVAKFYSIKQWFYFTLFLSIVIYGAYFSFSEISVFAVSINLPNGLATRLSNFMLLGLALSLILGEGGAFMMFLSNPVISEKQETETTQKQENTEPQPYNQETEENNTDLFYSPSHLFKISENECKDENGIIYDLQDAKNKFTTYKARITGSKTKKAREDNEKRTHFFNTIVWFIESKADNKAFFDVEEKPSKFYYTSQTTAATNGHKINPVQTALQI